MCATFHNFAKQATHEIVLDYRNSLQQKVSSFLTDRKQKHNRRTELGHSDFEPTLFTINDIFKSFMAKLVYTQMMHSYIPRLNMEHKEKLSRERCSFLMKNANQH